MPARRGAGEELGDVGALQESVRLYDAIAQRHLPDSSEWLATQAKVGGALLLQSRWDADDDNITRAIEVLRSVREGTERRRVQAPLDWASAEDHLGVALAKLADRELERENCESAVTHASEAVACMQRALSEPRRPKKPLPR